RFTRRQLTLAQRLILLVSALALPLLFVVGLSYNDQLVDRRASEATAATTAARDGAAVVEGFLRDLENSTFATAGILGGSLRAFGRPIFGPDGQTRAYVVTAFYPEKVIQVLRPDFPKDARLVLIDEKAHVVYDSGRFEPATSEIDVSTSPGVSDALAGKTVPVD